MKGDPRVEFALGAIGEYYPELIDLLKEAITSGRAVSATALAVDPARIYSEQELAGERRCVDALIRKHWDRCVADGLFSGTCEIAFHPDTGVPQIYASQSTPEDTYTAAEQALELLGALITDHWCAGETPLTMETWMTLLAGDEAIDTFDPRLFKRSTIVSTGLLEQGHYLVLCLALLTGVSPEELLRRFALMDRGPLEDLLGPCPDDSAVAATRFRVVATFTSNEVQHRNETTAPEHGVTECAYGGSEPIDQARIRTLNSEQLRPPSGQHNNADLIIWALHLCGGAERWVDVEELYLKAFELAPARLSWRTREDLPDYKKCAKALQEVEDTKSARHMSALMKQGAYERRLTVKGLAWCEAHAEYLTVLYSSTRIVPSASSQDDARRLKALTDSAAYRTWQESGAVSTTRWELAEAFRCRANSPEATWQARLDEHASSARRNGLNEVERFIELVRTYLNDEGTQP